MDKVKLKKWAKIILVLVVVIIAIVTGYKYYAQKQEEAKKPVVNTAQVQYMSMKSIVSATGTIKPVESVEVSSKNYSSCKTSISKRK